MCNSRKDEAALLAALCEQDDPRKTTEWIDGKPDYAEQLGVDNTSVAFLIEVARCWADAAGHEMMGISRDGPAVYAPVHAWRALAQMRAPEAAPALLKILDPLDAMCDDWSLEEFPYVFGLIGPAAIDPVAAYLADTTHREYSRVCAAHGLCRISERHTESRDDVVRRLSQTLGEFEREAVHLNGFLVSYLLELKAVESAETIERAYAAGCVDADVVGTWQRVRKDLGVDGIGLVRDNGDAPQPSSVTGRIPGHQPRTLQQSDRERRRAARKRARRNRRRGRR